MTNPFNFDFDKLFPGAEKPPSERMLPPGMSFCPGTAFGQRCGAVVDGRGMCPSCREASGREHCDRMLSPARNSIPPRYRWASHDAPELASRVRIPGANDVAKTSKAVLACLKLQVLTVIGASGAGKTSFATAVLRAHIEAGHYGATQALGEAARGARFFAARSLISDPADRLPPSERPQTIATEAPILLIDDVGQENIGGGYKASDRSRVIADVLMARHDAEARTIVTTYLTYEQFSELYGDGCARRYMADSAGEVRVVNFGRQK